MDRLWQIINHFFSLGSSVYFIIIVLFLLIIWLLKIIVFSKYDLITMAITCVFAVGAYFLTPNELIYELIVILIMALIFVWSFLDFVQTFFCEKAKRSCVDEFIKNAQYDYYYQTDKKDRLLDASISFLELGKITNSKLKKVKGIMILMNELNIVKINGKDINEDVAVAFYFEYGLTIKALKNYKCELLVLENETYSLYEVVIMPVHYKNKVLGRSVFLAKNRHVILSELKDSLINVKMQYEDAKLQTDLLMSMSENVVMYYDFLSQVMVATDAFCKFTNTNQKEYQLTEFYEMISSKDRNRYLEICETVNSTNVTRITYSLVIDQKELDVYEDTIYMKRDYGRISIIKPALKVAKPVDNKIKDDDVLEELKRINPRDVLEELSEILKVKIDEE